MLSELLQHVINGLIAGSIIALPALGLSLIFGVLGFINFSIASAMSAGALAGWVVNSQLGWPLLPCLAAAFLVAGLLGVAGDNLALAPIRKRVTPHTALMVAIVSIALNLALENGFRFAFGSDLRSYAFAISRDLRFGDIKIGLQQVRNVGIALSVAVALAAFFTVTRTGKAMRAVADNSDLARLKGIDPQGLANLATMIAMGLAGVGGALLAIDTNADPSTGARLLLLIFAASVLGGLTSLIGAVAGALLIGLVSEFSVSLVSPVYQSAVAFCVILLVLLARPSGLLGKARIRK